MSIVTKTLMDAQHAVDVAQELGNQPRVHPNGFIQLDLEPVGETWEKKRGHSGANRRLHIWNPPGITLPHQDTVNEIHDHVFDMKSTVVRGTLVQQLYCFTVGRDLGYMLRPPEIQRYELYRAVYDQASSSRLEPTGVIGIVEKYHEFPTYEGGSYTQPAFTFHDSDPQDNCVVTIMEKTKIRFGDASVLCPVGKEPDNTFDRTTAADTALLWSVIEGSLQP